MDFVRGEGMDTGTWNTKSVGLHAQGLWDTKKKPSCDF